MADVWLYTDDYQTAHLLSIMYCDCIQTTIRPPTCCQSCIVIVYRRLWDRPLAVNHVLWLYTDDYQTAHLLSIMYCDCVQTTIRPPTCCQSCIVIVYRRLSDRPPAVNHVLWLCTDDYQTAHLLSIIVELLTFCIEHHAHHIKNYATNKNLLQRVLVLLKSKHAFLALGIRLFTFLPICEHLTFCTWRRAAGWYSV